MKALIYRRALERGIPHVLPGARVHALETLQQMSDDELVERVDQVLDDLAGALEPAAAAAGRLFAAASEGYRRRRGEVPPS